MQHPLSLLRHYLECYGSDLDAWPDEARLWLTDARKDSAFADAATLAIEQEKRFEASLRARHFVHAHDDLAGRILLASRSAAPAQTPSPLMLLHSFTAYFRPTVLATVLALGFALGFSSFHTATGQSNASIQAYTDDDGAVL